MTQWQLSNLWYKGGSIDHPTNLCILLCIGTPHTDSRCYFQVWKISDRLDTDQLNLLSRRWINIIAFEIQFEHMKTKAVDFTYQAHNIDRSLRGNLAISHDNRICRPAERSYQHLRMAQRQSVHSMYQEAYNSIGPIHSHSRTKCIRKINWYLCRENTWKSTGKMKEKITLHSASRFLPMTNSFPFGHGPLIWSV